MKKLNILKLSIIAGLLSIGSSAWADQQEFFAKCTSYGFPSFSPFSGYEFLIPSPAGGYPQFVEGRSQRSPGEVVSVEARVHRKSWVSVLAQFEFEGEHVEIEFSNFNSPSIGTGVVAGESFNFACQLL